MHTGLHHFQNLNILYKWLHLLFSSLLLEFVVLGTHDEPMVSLILLEDLQVDIYCDFFFVYDYIF